MIEILDTSPDAILEPFLATDPDWTAYALCDLDPPNREHARFAAAVERGKTVAVLLIYQLPGMPSMLPFGTGEGIEAILQRLSDLPESVYLLIEERLLPAVSTRFTVDTTIPMTRMSVRARQVSPPPPTVLPVRALTNADLPQIQDLYRIWGNAAFTAEMLEHGVFVGAFDGNNLVAVAGTHAVSRTRRAAAIGGVFTRPEYRGRGLATATTGTVCLILADLDVDLIVLNVRSDNQAALAAYTRLGFDSAIPYLEGRADLR